jgi:hypothetical protein
LCGGGYTPTVLTPFARRKRASLLPSHSDLVSNVRTNVRVDVNLAVGAVTPQVTVRAKAVHLQFVSTFNSLDSLINVGYTVHLY